MEASDTDNSAKQFQLARNEAQDTPEKGGKEILTYQSSWMIVFLSEYLYTKESNWSKNARSEEVIVFMRFPHLAKQIFEKLSNKSLMECRQVNEFWKMAVDYEKIISIRKKTVLIISVSSRYSSTMGVSMTSHVNVKNVHFCQKWEERTLSDYF